MVVEHIERELTDSPLSFAMHGLALRVLAIHKAITRAAVEMRREVETRKLPGMGSTVAILVVPASNESLRPVLLHAGDSLLFRLREDAFKCLCRPHTTETQFGEAAHCLSTRERRALTRVVDHQCQIEAEVTHLDLVPGDIALVCTDGVAGVLSLEHLGQVLLDHSSGSPAEMAEAVTQAAVGSGGRDNASAVVVQFLPC